MQRIIIGTAGHVDHGKSTLVKAFTGIDPDRLPEEKQREMTTDLGFVFMPINETEEIAIIDVPGHERFLRTMIAGANSIRMVLFVVSADEGIMPQTIEHFDVLQLLGIERGIIVITKIDKVDEEYLSLIIEEIKRMTKGSFLEKAKIYTVSSTTNQGIEELSKGIKILCSQIEPLPDNGIFRCPIDRIFTIKGFGTVVCGTIISGRIKNTESVEILPIQKKSRIRNLQVHNQSVLEVFAGQRAAFNLMDVSVSEIERGYELSIPDYLKPTQILNANLSLLPNTQRPLDNNERIRLHKGTCEVMARVTTLEKDKIEPGARGYVQLRVEKPIVAEFNERFILRFYSPMRVIGGGRFLEAYAQKGRRFDKERCAYLKMIEGAKEKELIEVTIQYSSTQTIDERELMRRVNIPIKTINRYLLDLQKQNVLIKLDDNSFVHQNSFETLKKGCLDTLKSYFDKNPLKFTMGIGDLSKVLKISNTCLLQKVLEELSKEQKVELRREGVRPTGLGAKLSPDAQRLKERLEQFTINKGYRKFSLKEVLNSFSEEDEKRIRELFKYLLSSGILCEIREGFYLHYNILEQAKKKLIEFLKTKGSVRAVEFKVLLGISRDDARDLLDYFFRKGITVRTEGTHRLVKKENG